MSAVKHKSATHDSEGEESPANGPGEPVETKEANVYNEEDGEDGPKPVRPMFGNVRFGAVGGVDPQSIVTARGEVSDGGHCVLRRE